MHHSFFRNFHPLLHLYGFDFLFEAIWSLTLSCSLQIPGQRLAYRFGKLPYKYEPGVTRSRHAHRIRACIKRHMPQHSSSSGQIKPSPLSWSFSPVSTRLRKSCSWPLIPKPSYSISWYSAPPPHPPPICDYSKSKIIFPLFKATSLQGSENEVVYAVDLKASSSSSSSLQQRAPGATSMAVPVIKWIWERILSRPKRWALVQICFVWGKEIDQLKRQKVFLPANYQGVGLFVGYNNYIDTLK